MLMLILLLHLFLLALVFAKQFVGVDVLAKLAERLVRSPEKGIEL
jgi:hypothetical protein